MIGVRERARGKKKRQRHGAREKEGRALFCGAPLVVSETCEFMQLKAIAVHAGGRSALWAAGGAHEGGEGQPHLRPLSPLTT